MKGYAGKKVLVTGAGGFIGSHLAEALVRAGADVRAMVLYDSLGMRGWLDSCELAGQMEIHAGDIVDYDSVRTAMAGRDIVFHLAALIAIPYSYAAPLSYIRINIEGTANVLRAARDIGAKVVHTSTSEVYGTARYVPIDEAHPLQGQSPYSASKIGADKIAESFHLSFGLPVLTVRPFNTYGPRQSARAILPSIITQVQAGKRTIRLGNLTPTRDLTFVEDTAAGFIAAGTSSAAIGGTFNLGTGREISIGDLVGLVGRVLGQPVEVETDAARMRPESSEVERLLSDPSRAKAVFGWQAAVSLEDGIARAAEWFARNRHLYRAGEYVV